MDPKMVPPIAAPMTAPGEICVILELRWTLMIFFLLKAKDLYLGKRDIDERSKIFMYDNEYVILSEVKYA